MSLPQFVTIDIGTSSVRAAIVQSDGQVLAWHAVPHVPLTPALGWFEQDPEDWWQSTCQTVQAVLQEPGVMRTRLQAIAVCGQMHSPVPIDAAGQVLQKRVQLWNDKRPYPQVLEFLKDPEASRLCRQQGNPAACAWSAFKLAWMRQEQPEVLQQADQFLSPKDFVNFRLTGVPATDLSEASGSFFLNQTQRVYDPEVAERFGVQLRQLPEIHPAESVIGTLTASAAEVTGLPQGLPVVTGCGDFPAALLGSGVCEVGQSADITGTSTLLATLVATPSFNPKVGHLLSATGDWIQFAVLDAGGESIRWVKSLFGDASGWEDLSARVEAVEPGASGLLFLPYLNGERLGGIVNSRAQFFGMTPLHTPAHFYRAVMEGVAFAARRSLGTLDAFPTALTVSGGGAQSDAWLRLKASIYQLPLQCPHHVESSIMGNAVLAGVGSGVFPDLRTGVKQVVRLNTEVRPQVSEAAFYNRQFEVFDALYRSGQPLFSLLDSLQDPS